jgi:hypothetical protein
MHANKEIWVPDFRGPVPSSTLNMLIDGPVAAASSFPPRSNRAPFGRRELPLQLLPRRGVGRCRRPPVSAHGGVSSEGEAGRILDPRASPFQILGIDGSVSYSAAQLKAAFRARVVCGFCFLRCYLC